jgi:hypothetical protein
MFMIHETVSTYPIHAWLCVYIYFLISDHTLILASWCLEYEIEGV